MSTQPALLSTAVPGLDTILGGGFIPGSLVFMVGKPGAGKTILASQILFDAAREGTQCLILSAFSEGLVKLMAHLRPFSFFQEEFVGDKITVLSLLSLIGDDPTNAAKTIVQTIRQSSARIILIDGFQGMTDVLGSSLQVRQTLSELASLLSFLDAIIIVTYEGVARDTSSSAALTTADTIIGLEYHAVNGRHTRQLDVVKQRGAAPLPHFHTYTINSRGVTIFPRLESRPLDPSAESSFEAGRAPFGLGELDRLLHGGLTRRTTTILGGAPGVGKTTLALHWALMEATPTTATLFVSFGEYLEQLQHKSVSFGLDLEPARASGAVKLLRFSPVNIMPDVVAEAVIDAMTPNVTRLVIDDLAGLLYALGDRGGAFLGALAAHCYQRGITSVLLLELEALSGLRINLTETALSLVAENVILLQQTMAAGRLHRILAVLKMRFSTYDQTLREVVMDEQGLRVLTPDQTAVDVLEDAAREFGAMSPNVAVAPTADRAATSDD